MKRQAQINLGEEVQRLPFLTSSSDIMDVGARVIQDGARMGDIPIVEVVTSSSGDFEGLPNALISEDVPQASVTQEF